jgi:FkbM family methyltransferase
MTNAPGAMDLSYAQNLEDYHLARAFEGQTNGFYIDVGAGHPVCDNVSCWFYLQGWRGIVVEPQRDLADLYRLMRPRDLREACVLGPAAGEADFHVVERLHGFSTLLPRVAAGAANFGATFTCRKVTMKTLAGLCSEHKVERIDFLKIDVEGAEGEVLAGGDFARWRPRVIIVEALAPGTLAENWTEWEPLLLDRDYEFALFDGLNRFYVAREEPELHARFAAGRAEWLVVPHLGHTNRAPFRKDHPDHAFAKFLVENFLAELPRLSDEAILALMLRGKSEVDLGRKPGASDKETAVRLLFPGPAFPHASAGLAEIDAPTLREFYAQLVASDAFRVLKGRIAASYDGGQILEEE